MLASKSSYYPRALATTPLASPRLLRPIPLGRRHPHCLTGGTTLSLPPCSTLSLGILENVFSKFRAILSRSSFGEGMVTAQNYGLMVEVEGALGD